jgi:polysaccharide biosynthesis transport protein
MAMQQDLALSPGAQIDLRGYLSAVRRRYLYLLLTALGVFAAVCAVVYFVLPVTYQATAKVLIESQQVSSDLASSVVKASAAERVQAIQQRLMTEGNLLEIARKFDLYPEARARMAPSELVEQIRKATEIAQLDVGEQRPNTQSIGFTVSFQYGDPKIAASVANQFLTSILEQNVQSRQKRAAETTKFFEEQLGKLEQGLAQLDDRIAAFKTAHAAAMPETLTDRRTQLEQLQTAIGELDRRIALGTEQQQIVESKTKIVLLNSKLDSLKQQLRALDDQRRDLVPLLDKGYITKNRVLELDKGVASLEGDIRDAVANIDIENTKLGDSEAQIGRLPQQRAELAERATALQKTFLDTPQVEADYNALTREHENMQTEYTAVKAKLSAAATGAQLEEDSQAERFEVIERATVPSKPLSPDRPRIILGGAFGSVAAGIGMVVLMEWLDESIRNSADLERRLRIRPLATIPYVTTIAERNRKRRTLRVLLIYGGFLGIALLVLYKFAVFAPWLPLAR